MSTGSRDPKARNDAARVRYNTARRARYQGGAAVEVRERREARAAALKAAGAEAAEARVAARAERTANAAAQKAERRAAAIEARKQRAIQARETRLEQRERERVELVANKAILAESLATARANRANGVPTAPIATPIATPSASRGQPPAPAPAPARSAVVRRRGGDVQAVDVQRVATPAGVRDAVTVANWRVASRDAGRPARPYSTRRDASAGETFTFGSDKTSTGAAERMSVLSARHPVDRPDAVTSVRILHQREGRPNIEREITIGDWQRIRDRHARSYSYL